MRKYSIFIVFSFVLSAVFRIIDIILVSRVEFKILFFAMLFLGFGLIGIESFKADFTVKTVSYDSIFHLDTFAFICVCGMFADFISSAEGIYFCIIDNTVNLMRTMLEVCQCVFALLGCICFLLIALSYKKPGRFDFRKLGLFNLVLLLWALSRCFIGLTDIYELQDTSSIIMYLNIMLCLSAIYCFLSEILNDKPNRFSVFSFRCFGCSGGVCFLTQIVSVAHKDAYIFDEQTLFVISMYCISLFFYFLYVDIMHRQNSFN